MQDEICIDETGLGRQRVQLKKQKKEELASFAKDNPEEQAARILALMSSSTVSSTVLFAVSSTVSSANNLNSDLDETVVPPKPWL